MHSTEVQQSVKPPIIQDGVQFKYPSLDLLADSNYQSNLWEDTSDDIPTDNKGRLIGFIYAKKSVGNSPLVSLQIM